MFRIDANSLMWGAMKTIDSHETWGFTHTLPVADGDILKLEIDMRTQGLDFNPICRLQNVTQTITSGWWDCSADFLNEIITGELKHKVGFMAFHTHIGEGDQVDDWHILKLTFSHVYESGFFWKISRDGGETWEPSEGGWTPDTADLIDLGDYAGPGTAGDTVLVRGGLSYPQVMTHFALAWK